MTFWKTCGVRYPFYLKLESYLILQAHLEAEELQSGSVCKVIASTLQMVTCTEKATGQGVTGRLGRILAESLCDLEKSLVSMVFQWKD